MKKKLMLALMVATAVATALGVSHKLAMAAGVGDACTTEHGRSGYMVASGEDGSGALTCVADGGSEE